MWDNEELQNEADANGVITVYVRYFTEGGRETVESEWACSVIESHDDYDVVRAEVVQSYDANMIGDILEFEFEHDQSFDDLESSVEFESRKINFFH